MTETTRRRTVVAWLHMHVLEDKEREQEEQEQEKKEQGGAAETSSLREADGGVRHGAELPEGSAAEGEEGLRSRRRRLRCLRAWCW